MAGRPATSRAQTRRGRRPWIRTRRRIEHLSTNHSAPEGRTMRRLLVIPLLCVLAGPVAAQEKTEAAAKPAKKARPNAYDENADGKALVAAACAKAAKENKRV